MQSFFKKKQQSKLPNENQEKLAFTIAGKIMDWQKRAALWLQGKSELIPEKWKWILLVLFLVLAGIRIGYFIAYSITDRGNPSFHFGNITPFQLPDATSKIVPVVSDKEFLRLRRFKMYMDSLARSPTGKKKAKELLSGHPGLMDSISIVEEMYRQQHSSLNKNH